MRRGSVPHFEKMLYDNALLAHCYLEGFRALGVERYAQVAAATLDFMLDELQTDDGGFASALDADSPGGEGAFYVWSADEFGVVLREAGLSDDQVVALGRLLGRDGGRQLGGPHDPARQRAAAARRAPGPGPRGAAHRPSGSCPPGAGWQAAGRLERHGAARPGARMAAARRPAP